MKTNGISSARLVPALTSRGYRHRTAQLTSAACVSAVGGLSIRASCHNHTKTAMAIALTNLTLESTFLITFKERDDARLLVLVELNRNQGEIYSYMYGAEMKLLKTC